MTKQQIPIKPENSTFTDGQWQAIYESGHNILVSASAGSGKTTVLVKRVIEKIKNGTDIDDLLIVTYTEAAAKEMKERIESALREAIEKEVDSAKRSHYLKQLQLIPTASISTLHAFCLQVIRRYYYVIEMDPVFRLLTDETEMLLLKEDVWEELREMLYADENPLFYQLTENFSSDRNDDGLMQLLFSLYDFARSKADPVQWLDDLPQTYEVTRSLDEMPLYQTFFKPELLSDLQLAHTQLEQAVRLTEGSDELQATKEQVLNEKYFFEQLMQLVEQNKVEDAYDLMITFSFERFKGAKRNADEWIKETAQEVKALRDASKAVVAQLQKTIFAVAPQDLLSFTEQAQPLVAELARVCLLFHEAYTLRKQQQGVLDFNDLEHQTLNILTAVTDESQSVSEASAHYRRKFEEVLVDEYQDINQLQETILYWVTRQEMPKNMFMVGDVKQSIYSFRLADPTLFINKYNAFADQEEEQGNRIILAENFRSRKSVLDFTNLVFQQLMDEDVGQIAYDQAAELINGFQAFPDNPMDQTEILLYEKSADEEKEELPFDFEIEDKTEGELRMVAQKIKQLIQEKFPIYDKKMQKNRPICYKDIVLLTPTKKNNLLLLDLFKEMDIPLHVNDTQNYFQATEIQLMIALLKMIDNPYQDIPVASVLRSPVVGLKENDLAEIRLADRKGNFYEAVLHYAENLENPTVLQEKLQRFLEQFESWRDLSRQQSLATLIWQIYQDTGFLDYVGGMPAGKQRQANLHALYERAASYEEMSFKGLFQFVRFIEKMQEKDKDLAEPTTIGAEEDAVRVMTIHASKGLEFPVVFVLDLTKRFNLSDLHQRYVFEEEQGIGVQYLDPEHRYLAPTLPYLAIRMAKRKKLLAEEMRKLYVALTRAEEKLFLVGSYKDEASAWKEWSQAAEVESGVLPASLRLNSTDLMKWIGYSLIRYPDAQTDKQEFVVKERQHPARFAIHFVNQETLYQQQLLDQKYQMIERTEQPKQLSVEAKEYLRRAYHLLDFTYPYEMATRTTSYQSVSEIKRVFEDPDDSQLLTLDLTAKPKTTNRFVEETLAKPQFLMQEQLSVSSTDIGSATHLVLQLLDLSQQITEESLLQFIKELVAEQLLSEAVAKQIPIQAILIFLDSPLGQKMQSHPQQVVREQPFSMLLRAKEIFDGYSNESDQILVHGIIDGYMKIGQEVLLFDYKTDRIQSQADQEEIQKIVKKYQGQLYLYRLALEQALNEKVTQTSLVLLRAGRVVDLMMSDQS